MNTTAKIIATYRAAKIADRDHAGLLEIEDDGDMVTIRKNDPTGYNTCEWEIWVHRSARRQVARVYVAATCYEAAITADDAATVIMLDSDPEAVVEQTRWLNRQRRARHTAAA